MLFNGRALIFTFSRTQVGIAEIERLQSGLFKMSMVCAQAIVYLEKAIKMDNTYLDAVYILADILGQQQKYQKGIELYVCSNRLKYTHDYWSRFLKRRIQSVS